VVVNSLLRPTWRLKHYHQRKLSRVER